MHVELGTTESKECSATGVLKLHVDIQQNVEFINHICLGSIDLKRVAYGDFSENSFQFR